MPKVIFKMSMFLAVMFVTKAVAEIMNMEFYNLVAGVALYISISALVDIYS